MRPLSRPPSGGALLDEKPASALLMAAFGPFCMFSERPLPSVAHVWHAGSGLEITKDKAAAVDWNQLYLLDDATFKAVQRRGTPSGILLPDRTLTYSRRGGPFVYGLEDVRRIFLDEEESPTDEAETISLAVVRGTTPEARQTIDAFALNSPYFDAETRELRIPRADYLSMVDHRVFERTTAWRRAERSAELLRKAIGQVDDQDINLLLDQIRLTVNVTGHWSVWATVLGGVLQDGALLGRALCTPKKDMADNVTRLRGTLGAVAAPIHLGYGPHNVMPGTRPDWLD